MTTSSDQLLRLFRTYLQRFERQALHGFLDDFDRNLAGRNLNPRVLLCLRFLDRLADIAPPEARPLCGFLANHGKNLGWGQTYTADDFGANFIDNYGWLEVFGTRGVFVHERMAAGFLLLGPGVVYPDHHHIAEEVYIPLSGMAFWRKGDSGFEPRTPGEVVHHPSGVSHAMRTADQPLLALYLWCGGPLAQRSTIVGKSGNNSA